MSPAACAATRGSRLPGRWEQDRDLDVSDDFWISFVVREDQLVPVSGSIILRAGDEIPALPIRTRPGPGADLHPEAGHRPRRSRTGLTTGRR
jgi:hypothetical protein